MPKTKSATAAKKDVPEIIKGYLKPMAHGIFTTPHLITATPAPKLGDVIDFETPKSGKMTGRVSHFSEDKGMTIIGFADGVKPKE